MSNIQAVADYMVTKEEGNSELVAVDPSTHSLDWMDSKVDYYPVIVRLPPQGQMNIYATGTRGGGAATEQQKSQQIWEESMDVAILVGPGAANTRRLTQLGVAYLAPYYRMWLIDHTMGGLIEVIQLGGNYRMGDFTFLDTKHFAVVIPTLVRYRKHDQVDR